MKVVFVVGPTAAGKSEIALKLASYFDGAVVNCDSIQIYKNLDIGSAKPTASERKLVPHFLYDEIAPPREITAGEYHRLFFSCLETLQARFPVVFVVGGTGFYFQAIEKGMYQVKASDPAIKAEIQRQLQENDGPEKLYGELLERDPESAAKISKNDHYRLERALVVLRTTGRTMSEAKKEFQALQKSFPFPLLKLGIEVPKEELVRRIQIRTKAMLEKGLLNEVRDLLREGLGHWAPLSSVGYREAASLLSGEIKSHKELEGLICQSTWQLAKKQKTWFKRDHEIFWGSPQNYDVFRARVEEFLSLK